MMRIKEQDKDALTLEVSGTLTREDYAEIVPRLEALIEQQGKLRALVELNEFEGWRPTALVDELRFDIRHRSDIERVALLGEGKAEKALAKVAAPLFSGEVRFFPKEQIIEAKTWLSQH